MIPFRRTFDSEKQQLQQLNSRLGQYLSRTKLLEEENLHLQAEITKLRHAGGAGPAESHYKAELQALRRSLDQLSLEKSQVELEREQLWRELQVLHSLCSEQSDARRDARGDLKARDQELQRAHHINNQLQLRLSQLEHEHQRLEDAHAHQKVHLQQQVRSRPNAPVINPQTLSVDVHEVEQCARSLSEGWVHTMDRYQQKVCEMEQAMQEDKALLEELQREKVHYVTEMESMRKEAERQARARSCLEEEVMKMKERFHSEFSEYEMIIKQLEQERNVMVGDMREKMREHQALLQVKMDLGMEVAAYRALLEGERIGLQDVQRRGNQPQRERVIEIKLPDQPYTPRTSMLTSRQQTNIRYMPPSSDFRKSPAPPSACKSPSRVVPISFTERTRHQSPASRRDMVSFTKARAANSITANSTTTTTIKDTPTGQRENQTSPSVQKSVKSNPVSHERRHISSSHSPTTETDSVKLMSPSSASLSSKTGSKNYSSEKQKNIVHDEFKDKDPSASSPSETKLLDSVSVEEIIEKVIKPAGLEAKACSSGESQVRYHVETIEQEDGTAKTQIVLESKVEEELDVTEDSSLDELLKQGAKKVLLEDIKNTETGSMIRNLLKGLQGGDNLQNKSFSVEIIEAPAQPQSDVRLEMEQTVASAFNEPSTSFKIEELENITHTRDEYALRSYTPDTDPSHSGFERIQEVSRESESSQLSQDLHEYFVSTPDENFSDPEEGSGITSYGHYGIVDDLSDERYYQDEAPPQRRVTVKDSERKLLSGDLFGKESFPECIIEEEVRVSPIVQESVLEYLREDSLEPKEQLKGALEKLQSAVSGPLKEELAFFTKMSNESPQNVAVDIKKVQQSCDNGTTTIVAELNVSQTLEDSGLLDAGDDLSDEQILAALRSSNLGFDEAFQTGAGAGYTIRVSTEGHGFGDKGESVYEITEKSLKSQLQSGSSAEKPEEKLQTTLQVHQEKKIATILLESPSDV